MRAVVLLLLVAAVAHAKTYGERELEGILRNAGMDGYRGVSLAKWMCILKEESSYRSHIINKNPNGSTDYGIFQINNKYWCSDPNYTGRSNSCNVACSQLATDDIHASIECAKKIVRQQGLKAWVAWNTKCSKRF